MSTFADKIEKRTMKLAIMTKSTFFVEEDKILATLFEAGLDNLHLYKPGSSPIYSERLLSLLPDTAYDKITVHEHFYLKDEYRLAGIHIDTPDERPPFGYKGRISATCRDISKLKDMKRKFTYVFLANVFNYGDTKPTLNMNELEEAARHGLIDKHVFALGGINDNNIQTIKDLGFGGVVICEDLWKKFDIHNQRDYKELISHFERLKKLVY